MGAETKIGLVGIGMMGWPMGACLAKAGFTVVAYDARPEQSAAFAKEVGGETVSSLAELGRTCSIVVTMLPTSKIVSDVLLGDGDAGGGGIAEGMAKGGLVIDMTSGVPDVTISLEPALNARGIAIIDAPVSGGVARARTGELAIMAGGAEADIERARPVLEAMGKVQRAGSLGCGQAMKALNNLVSAGGFLIGVEAMLVGKKFGLDPEVMVDILNASTGMNNSTQKKFKQFVLSGAFNSGFALDLMVKDLSIALDVAKARGVPTPFAALCREMWASADAMLGKGADHTALALLSERLANLSLREDEGIRN